jgi:hypothetical protein
MLDATIAALEQPPLIGRTVGARIDGRVAHLRELCDSWLRDDE